MFKKISPDQIEEPNVSASSGSNNGFLSRRRISLPKFSKPSISFSSYSNNKKKFGIYGGIIAGIILVLFLVVGLPLFFTYQSAKKLQASASQLKVASQAQDLEGMKASLAGVKKDLTSLDNNLKVLSWLGPVPFVGGYVQDARHATRGGLAGVDAGEIMFTVVEPYADIIGLKGAHQAEDGQKTAEDRINFIVESIGQVVPHLDQISQKTTVMAQEFSRINPDRYPETFQGKPVKKSIRDAKEAINNINELVTGGKPVLEQAPYLLGIDGERTYLLLFQNDKELRPTGGFLSAYAIVKVNKGKFNQVASNDIYNLDKLLKSRIPAPDAIKRFLPLVPYWNLRDMNLSPDFKVSMDTFIENYNKTKSPKVDGIIAVDTNVAVELLKVIGEIGVSGFGNFSAEEDKRCNCPNVVYELESFADVAGAIVWADDLGGKIVYAPKNYDNRKYVLGPLMNSLLSNSMGQPKEKIPDLFNAGFNAMLQKHILFYISDPEVQEAMEAFNLAGRVKEFSGDYLHINNTNFAGAKSNLYVEESVNVKVEPQKDGTAVNTLTISYKNPQKHDGWLNGPYRDYFRVYVPKGATLVDSTGSEIPVETQEDLGKTVFQGFFQLRPEGVLTLTIKYKTPKVVQNGRYNLLIQKQPGTTGDTYQVQYNKEKQEFELTTDKELNF